MNIPKMALSVRQPWAWLIVNGWKDIENRTWRTGFHGPVLIHAAKGMTEDEYRAACRFLATDSRLVDALRALPDYGDFQRGGVVGMANLTECVEDSSSPWFVGPVGFKLTEARTLPFLPCRGALGFFRVDYPAPAGDSPGGEGRLL